MSNILFPHEGVILDACCIINLYASGHMQSILESIPGQVAVAAYVYNKETHRIYSGPDEDVTRETELINLQPFVDRKLLQIVTLEDEFEANTAVDFSAAVALDSGEAVTAAIAVHRSWTLVTDDKAAISFLMRKMPEVHLISTPDILKYWVDTMRPHLSIVSMMLRNIRKRAKYEPHESHHLHNWWQTHRESRSNTAQ